MQQLPKNYPNMYIYDDYNYSRNYVIVITYLNTPKGRISTYYQYVKQYFGGKNSAVKTVDQALLKAKGACISAATKAYANKLKKGYTLGEVYIKSIVDFN